MNHASKTRTLLVLCACGMSVLAMTADAARTIEHLATGTIEFVPEFNGPANVFLDKFTTEPGDFIFYHTHPGDSVNVVTQGTVTLTNRCGAKQHFSVGETFVEAAEVVHSLTNEGSEPAVFFAEVVGPGGVVGFTHGEPDCSIQGSLKPLSLGFGPRVVNTRQTQSFRLRNTGTAALPLRSLELTGRNAGAFHLAYTCGESLEVGKSCLINIAFRPTSAGAKSAKLRVVAADNLDDLVFTRDLTGTAVKAD